MITNSLVRIDMDGTKEDSEGLLEVRAIKLNGTILERLTL